MNEKIEFYVIPHSFLSISSKVNLLTNYDPMLRHDRGDFDLLGWCAEHLSKNVELILPPVRLRKKFNDAYKLWIWTFANPEDYMAFKLSFPEFKHGSLPEHLQKYFPEKNPLFSRKRFDTT